MKERRLRVSDIRLDPKNPRLPEDVRGQAEPVILEYLYDNAVLDELARSFVNNGFFQHEPVMVVQEHGEWIVLEGNRRVAALKVLLEHEAAEEAELSFALEDELSEERVDELQEIPVFVVDDRELVRKYLGFRHIGGIKTWSAEAKARYLAEEVDRVAEEPNPFLDVARRVGSNVQGVRNAYIAISILRHARDELGINVGAVQKRRFGVWVRCMNSPELRDYIGLGDPRTFAQVKEALEELDLNGLSEVLGDLIPRKGRRRAVLTDSRDVTIYAKALLIETAREAIRDYGDFELARQIVEQADLGERLDSLRRSMEAVLQAVTHATDLDSDVLDSARAMGEVARAIEAVVAANV